MKKNMMTSADELNSWDVYRAKAWMIQTGMDHIKDHLYTEGGELIYESKWGNGCDTEALFKSTILNILCWDRDMIDDTIISINNIENYQ